MTRKFLLAALVILTAALCTVHLITERTPPENVVSPSVHLGMVVPREALEKLKASIEIDGKQTRPAKVLLLHQKDQTAMLSFELCEGRNRQIRRLCEYAGITVTRLRRVQEGNLGLGDLPVGKWRRLTEEEIRQL